MRIDEGKNYAELRLPASEWSFALTFTVLRAVHYLAEYHGVSELKLNVAEVPDEALAEWRTSLARKKYAVDISCNAVLDSSDMPEFAAPDYKVRLNGREIIELGIPDIPGLTDFHMHSRLAYCSENMDVARAAVLAELAGVKHINIAEHSGQLYCTPDVYWNNRFRWSERKEADFRTADYLALIDLEKRAGCSFGLEIDVDEDAVASDVPGVGGFRLGAVHFLGKNLTFEEQKADFMRRLDALVNCGIDILAHPFRVFLKGGLPIPEELFEGVAEKLVRAGVAAEINFHTNRPQPEFVKLLLKKGGKISFGTDSHNLYEAGFLRPHYDFCRELDIAGRLDEVLLSAENIKRRREK